MSEIRLVLLAVVAAAVAVSRSAATDSSGPPSGAFPDYACGPRAVHCVLSYYGVNGVSVMELVKEMQATRGQGVSIDKLEEALERRGIYTAAIRVNNWARIQWPHLAIVILKGGDDGVNHSVVWLPSETENAVSIWDGLRGRIDMSEADFAARRTGEIILTSPVPIANSGRAITIRWGAIAGHPLVIGAGGVAVFAAVSALCAWYLQRGPRTSSRSDTVNYGLGSASGQFRPGIARSNNL